ncbi:hypothetical protein ACFFGH_16345 [Lysobacter korlensis]|uniref:7-cyano-7-deazaguanine synthase n=1 Tax=Lysobacter korlensis TaxID=553636 RepID=A0ABV6RSM9_9GAMM
MDNHNTDPVHLLWTGGWDSTFQLLRLLLVHRLPVRPIYLIDENRSSLDVELRTMERIRDALARHYPETRTLMLPTMSDRVSQLPADPEIEQAFARLLRECPIGTQYEWLAKFCRQHGLRDVEVGFERTRNGAGALLTDLGVAGTSAAGYPVHRISPDGQHPDAQLVFGAYACPLFEISKQEMAQEVDARGWRPIMLETWFCHRPAGTEPCGMCNPCVGVVKAGLGWRIPSHRRAYAAVHRATIGLVKKTARRFTQRTAMA